MPKFNVVSLSWAEAGWDSSLCNVDALSRPQTMRRQRTEVVVELRKVRTFVMLCCQLQTLITSFSGSH